MKQSIFFLCLFFLNFTAFAQESGSFDGYLVKLRGQAPLSLKSLAGIQARPLALAGWVLLKSDKALDQQQVQNLFSASEIEYIQPNYKLSIPSFQVNNPQLRETIIDAAKLQGNWPLKKPAEFKDNPEIPTAQPGENGDDPFFGLQWGMLDIGVKQAWSQSKGSKEVIVAVIDTGIDYTHEDLNANLWRNPGESGLDKNGKDKAQNGVDDDGNGYIDDLIGWDFSAKDNKPYDMSVTGLWASLKGGNPGHGTHCAGNIAARADNGKGIAGIAPGVRLMAVRFLSEKGQGSTADGIEAIIYAVRNGAQILSNSWGSEGEEKGSPENKALREAIQFSQDQGRLFIAAAGNGHMGRGYDNDNDEKPAYPASYEHENIISVAAIGISNRLGAFSNWGAKSVDLAAPGLRIFSTVPGNRYADTVLKLGSTAVHWDGTSMATPHVAGAAALYWSKHRDKTWREVKQAILDSAAPLDVLQSKTVSGGKLDVQRLLR